MMEQDIFKKLASLADEFKAAASSARTRPNILSFITGKDAGAEYEGCAEKTAEIIRALKAGETQAATDGLNNLHGTLEKKGDKELMAWANSIFGRGNKKLIQTISYIEKVEVLKKMI